MPRIAALYDIHGNLPALEAVLDEVTRERVDAVIVGGDVLPGPMPSACLERLLATGLPTRFIHGNGESAALESLRGGALDRVPAAFRPAVQWSASQLSQAQSGTIEHWPLAIEQQVDGIGTVHFCHATPRNDTEIFTRLSPDERIRVLFAGVSAPLAVCGHTHMQFDRTVDSLRIVNAGSVGMPFGEPGAHWLLLGPGIQLQRTPYDLDAAADRIRRSEFPGADAFANQVLKPRSEAEMLRLYEG